MSEDEQGYRQKASRKWDRNSIIQLFERVKGRPLSPREHTITDLILCGFYRPEIAKIMLLAEDSVSQLLRSIYLYSRVGLETKLNTNVPRLDIPRLRDYLEEAGFRRDF